MDAKMLSNEDALASVVSVNVDRLHNFSKSPALSIRLLEGLGVEGDAHCGETVQHRSRVARDPTQPNLRQVHLLHAEVFEELTSLGYSISPGDLGENITTRGIQLLDLPTGSILHIGLEVRIRLTGLRNPCWQLDHFRQGLVSAVLSRDADGVLIRKAGVMAVVVQGGLVQPDDTVTVSLPPGPHHRLERV